jgi:hypothetical protein
MHTVCGTGHLKKSYGFRLFSGAKASGPFFLACYHAFALIIQFIGESPSGKAGAFEAPIPWFESMLPSHQTIPTFL